MDPPAQPDPDRFYRQEGARDATAIRSRKSRNYSAGAFSRAQSERSRRREKTSQGRAAGGCPKYFGKPRREGDRPADQRLDGPRPFYRSGMEKMVGIRPQTDESKRRVLDSGEEDGTDPNSGGRRVAKRRINFRFQQCAATEAAIGRARADRKILTAIQGAGETTAAGHHRNRERRDPEPKDASRACLRAGACARRFARAVPAIENDAHRTHAREINSGRRKTTGGDPAEAAGGE